LGHGLWQKYRVTEADKSSRKAVEYYDEVAAPLFGSKIDNTNVEKIRRGMNSDASGRTTTLYICVGVSGLLFLSGIITLASSRK
jgi:hypothetical protein